MFVKVVYDLLRVLPVLSLHKEPYWWSRPFQNSIKIVFYPRGQVQWLVPSLLIHAHSVFPSPHVKLDAWSQESPVWTKARLPGKEPFFHITSICKLRRQKKRCLTHEGDRRNNWLMGGEPLKMKGLYVMLITTFISPGASAFSAATGRSSVCPECKSSGSIPQTAPAHGIRVMKAEF